MIANNDTGVDSEPVEWAVIMPLDGVRAMFERELLILDGAMGTELERRGVACPAPLWSAAALLECPELVRQIHGEYVRSGADVLIANTFRTNRHAVRDAGMEQGGAELTALAVDLAREAVAEAANGRSVLVAASVAPVRDCYTPAAVPSSNTLRDEHRVMAQWVAEAAPDLAWIETMGTLQEAAAAGEALRSTGLPLAMSFTLHEDGRLLGGETLSEAAALAEAYDLIAIGCNCIPPRAARRAVSTLSATAAVPVAVYAHVNNAVPTPGWSYAEQCTPVEYAAYAQSWRAGGARIIGGCCGTTPDHVAAVHNTLRGR